MHKEISLSEALHRKDICFVDVRSPKEFAEASIPGAINIPIFSDEERHVIGEVYVQESKEKAKMLALTYVSPKLPEIVKSISDISSKKKPIIFCWRGGMRSRSIVQVCNLMGIDVYQLAGGYKAYRQYVVNRLNNFNFDKNVVSIHGLTGVGKTMVIKRLERNNFPTIDLEEFANHRGSVFGDVGISKPNSQKQFEAFLLLRLDELEKADFIVTEAESRRIGNCFIPAFLFEKMKSGYHILLEASLQTRVKRILQEYYPQKEDMPVIRECIERLKPFIGGNKTAVLINYLDNGDFANFVESLLVEYYDPLYTHSLKGVHDYVAIINFDNWDEGMKEIEGVLNKFREHQ